MIQWEVLSDAEQEKLIEVANGMAAITGESANGYFGAILEVVEAEISRATRIPAHLFEPTETAAGRPMPVPDRFRRK